MSSISAIRTRWAAVGAAVAITLGAVGLGTMNIASADVSSGDRPVFISINPCRLIDTRPGGLTVGPRDTKLGAGETLTVTAHGTNGECRGASAIPSDALSVSLNVTAIGATARTFLTFWGDGANPGTSNLNPRPGAPPTPNSVNTPLSAAGTFNIYNDAGDVNLIADVNGYYASHDHDDRYEQLPSRITIAPMDFEKNSVGIEWAQERRGTIFHSSTPEPTCAAASIRIPAAHDVTGAEAVYIAGDENDETTFEVNGIVGRAGAYEFGSFEQDVATFMGTLEATPSAGGGAAALTQIVEKQALVLDAGATQIDSSGYVYSVKVCTSDKLEIYAFHVDIAPST